MQKHANTAGEGPQIRSAWHAYGQPWPLQGEEEVKGCEGGGQRKRGMRVVSLMFPLYLSFPFPLLLSSTSPTLLLLSLQPLGWKEGREGGH